MITEYDRGGVIRFFDEYELFVTKTDHEQAIRDKQQEVESLTYELCEKGREIEELRGQIAALRKQIKDAEKSLRDLNDYIEGCLT